MHIQPHFSETRPIVLHELIRAKPLATLIVIQDNEIVVNHMPLMIISDGSDYGVLRGHIPRANSIWNGFDGVSTKAVAVFQGPDSFVTPSWYPSKHQHGKVVPTWNYVVAHAHGYPRAIHDSEWLLNHLGELTDWQESDQELPWKVSDAPADFIDKMLQGIVGIEMSITRLDGKWKVSQNRPEADQQGVAAGLRNRGTEDSLAMETLVRQHSDNQQKPG